MSAHITANASDSTYVRSVVSAHDCEPTEMIETHVHFIRPGVWPKRPGLDPVN